LEETMKQIPDFSYLNPFLQCQRQWYHKFVEGLEPRESNILLHAGSVGHLALAEWYASGKDLETMLRVLIDNYSAKPTGRFEYLTLGHMEVILRNYHDRWLERDFFEIISHIEEPITATIDGFTFGGIPDMIIEEDSEPAVMDHKFTTGYLGGSLFTRMKFTKQMPLYCILATKKLGRPVRRAVVDAIHMGPKASDPGSKVNRFERYEFGPYTDAELTEALEWVKVISKRLYFFDDPLSYPQHGGTHCQWCDYKELCEVAPFLRQTIKESNFKKREITGRLLSGADS
jgi:hypothetical protein